MTSQPRKSSRTSLFESLIDSDAALPGKKDNYGFLMSSYSGPFRGQLVLSKSPQEGKVENQEAVLEIIVMGDE